MARAARMPMIATTIMSSTRVKPRLLRSLLNFIIFRSFRLGGPFQDATGHPTHRSLAGASRPDSLFAFALGVELVRETRADEEGERAITVAVGGCPHDVPVRGVRGIPQVLGRTENRLRRHGVGGLARRAGVAEGNGRVRED